MITLYAITDHPTPPVPGLGATHVVARGNLAAVCGPVTKAEVTADALWQHEQVVEALMTDRDVLPVRYGTCLPDDAAAARTLDDNHAEFAASLEAIRGAVELAVRVFPALGHGRVPTSAAASMTGTEYLRARARSAAEESDVSLIVHDPLARAARAVTVARVNRPGELLRAAYLVDRGSIQPFSTRVKEIQEVNPQLRITCTGPWPPYSFTSR